METDEAGVLESDFNAHGAEEVLNEWVRRQMGKGRDDTPPPEQDIFNIEFNWNPEGDSITCTHDCVNESLALGIVTEEFMKKGIYEKLD